MASYLVRSGSLTTNGTTDADFFQVNSGGVSAASINGLAGNDTITIEDSVASARNASIDLAGGKDVLTASGTDFQSSNILLGAGGDKLVSHNSHFGGVLKAGDGNDTITLSAGVIDSLYGGGGDDNIVASALISGTAAVIGLGAGKDTLSMTANYRLDKSAQIFGGGGNDSLVISGAANDADGLLINLDSTVNGGGADTLSIVFTGASATIKGKGGKDVITVGQLSELGASSQILGNAGADSIVINGKFSADSNVTVGGGSGNDTIELSATTTASIILGGGGRDSINIDGATGANKGGTIFGGGGADSITFSAGLSQTGNQEVTQAIGFKSFTDSTADSSDLITYTNTVDGVTTTGLTTFNISMDGLGSAHTAEAPSLNSASITSGVATFSSVSAVSDRISKLDAILTTTGQYAIFADNEMSAGYLFIQGGTNDIVAKFVNPHDKLTGLVTEAVAGSAFSISFGVES